MKHELQVNWSDSKHLGSKNHGFHRCETVSKSKSHLSISPRTTQVEQKGHWENRMMNVIRGNRVKSKAGLL